MYELIKGFIMPLLISIVAVFAPIHAILITTMVLIFMDLILGTYAAYKRGEEITSAGLRRTITKMFVYQIVLMTSFLGETYLLGGIIPVVKLVAGFIGLVEIKSLLENASSITNLDFKSIIKKLGSKNDE